MLEELSRWPVGRRAGGWCQTNGSLWQGSDLLCTVISLASLVSEWKPINQADMPLHWFCPEESAHKRWISFYRPAPQASPQWSGQNITISGRQEYESRYECSEVSACGERSWADCCLGIVTPQGMQRTRCPCAEAVHQNPCSELLCFFFVIWKIKQRACNFLCFPKTKSYSEIIFKSFKNNIRMHVVPIKFKFSIHS